MRRLVFARRARRELSEIRAYIAAADAPRAAMRVVERLAEACEALAEFSELGRVGYIPGTWELVTVKPYVVVYTVTDEVIEVVRVIHGAQRR